MFLNWPLLIINLSKTAKIDQKLTSNVRILKVFDDRLPGMSDKVKDCNARDPNPDEFFEPDSTRVTNV